MDTYNISKELLNKIFIELINKDSIRNSANKDSISHILLKDLPEHSVETIIHLILTEEPYQTLAIGDHFKVKPISYHASKHYETDVLCDMGLCDGEGNVFGYVVSDGSWSSSREYNPFYKYLKVKLYYHDTSKQLIEYDQDLSPLELTKINKLDIPYFNKEDVEEPVVEKPLVILEQEPYHPF
jgi:hypothetical protein